MLHNRAPLKFVPKTAILLAHDSVDKSWRTEQFLWPGPALLVWRGRRLVGLTPVLAVHWAARPRIQQGGPCKPRCRLAPWVPTLLLGSVVVQRNHQRQKLSHSYKREL